MHTTCRNIADEQS